MAKPLTFQRETVELLPLTVRGPGGELFTDYQTCIAERNTRPSSWKLAVTLDDDTGVMVEGLERGVHIVYVRALGGVENPVRAVGQINVE